MPVEVHVGRTPEIIELAECCVAVSGSVSLEMMYRRTPAVIVYRMRRFDLKVAKMLVKIPYITLVNLLANEEVYPEFPTDRDPSEAVAARVLEFLNDPGRGGGGANGSSINLCDEVARPGSVRRGRADHSRGPDPPAAGQYRTPMTKQRRHLVEAAALLE